jgi:hypothetical protein
MANASATQQHQSVVVAYSLTGVWRRCIRYKTRPVSKDAGLLFFRADKNLNTGKTMMNSQVTRWHWWRFPV